MPKASIKIYYFGEFCLSNMNETYKILNNKMQKIK